MQGHIGLLLLEGPHCLLSVSFLDLYGFRHLQGQTTLLGPHVPQDLFHTLRLSVSRSSRGDQSIQHPADRAVVHPSSPHPSPRRGVWGFETALRPLSQRVTPAAVMLATASSQEERHRLGRLQSPLRGGPLHPDRQPRDVNCGAGPRRQVTERWEGRNIKPLRIANSNWADGSAPLTSSWSGSAASWSPSRSDGGRAMRWGGSSFRPGSSLASLSDSSVSGTWVRMNSGFSCPTTGLGLNTAGSGRTPVPPVCFVAAPTPALGARYFFLRVRSLSRHPAGLRLARWLEVCSTCSSGPKTRMSSRYTRPRDPSQHLSINLSNVAGVFTNPKGITRNS